MPLSFDKDEYNVTATDVAFFYYDHHSNTDMFIKLQPLPFSLTIERYIESTGIATGTFEGSVYTPDRATTYISDGRFMVKLK